MNNIQITKASQTSKVCRDFMYKKCSRTDCKFKHDDNVCFYFWKNKSCKFRENCTKKHDLLSVSTSISINNNRPKKHNRPKNTECFEPMTKPVDLRVVLDLGNKRISTPLTSRDVLLVPNLFLDYQPLEIYNILASEIDNCTVPKEQLLKMWHGNDKIDGTHLIANDRTSWKQQCPAFQMIVNRLADFFNMKVEATRFNLYKDTSQWKPFHHDSAYVDPKKAEIQNFTVAVSFGATRDAAFEKADNKTVISMPQPDGTVYCFSKDTNVIWRHGILQDNPIRQEGRISIILWGSVDQTIIF